MAAHDDFQKDLGTFGGEMFHAKIVDANQIGLEIFGERALGFGGRLIGLKLADQIKDRAIKRHKTRTDDGMPDGLSQSTFPDTWRPKK